MPISSICVADSRSHFSQADILANPYLISELDLGDAKEPPVSVGVIDRGMLPEDTIKARHPLPDNCEIKSIEYSRGCSPNES